MVVQIYFREQLHSSISDGPSEEMEVITIDEYGYSEAEDAEWEDAIE
jgi:hypothetical protein